MSLAAIAALTLALLSLVSAQRLDGDARRWHTVTLSFHGPHVSESGNPNPFTHFRLDVSFMHRSSGARLRVPGYFAADGNAATTGATVGNVWRVHLAPPRTGWWHFVASFRKGPYVASSDSAEAGEATAFDGLSGSFEVHESDAGGKDLRAKGRLQYVGQRYFRFANGEVRLKLGTNTPENLLGYTGFDGEDGQLTFEPHVADWQPSDPAWGSGNRGAGLIGAVNYLASQGVNSLFSIIMTVYGDSKGQVHPWLSQNDRERYDVSRLDQWQIVFRHAESKGMALNLALCETENEALFEHDAGASTKTGFAASRKIYYREVIARFSHNLGLIITLGEENGWNEKPKHGGGESWGVGNTQEQRRRFTSYIRRLDPYACPILVHTYPPMKNEVYGPMLGPKSGVRVEGASLQMGTKWSTNRETLEWISRSTNSGLPWVVTADEIGSGNANVTGGVPLAGTRGTPMSFRALFCWGNILAGGGGIEVFSAAVDQSLDNFRRLQSAWGDFHRAILLFEQHEIPFWTMSADRWSVRNNGTKEQDQWIYTLSNAGDVYVTYHSGNVQPAIDLTGYSGEFSVRWFNPRAGASNELQKGSVWSVQGGSSSISLGKPPDFSEQDSVVIVAKKLPFKTRRIRTLTPMSPRDLIPGSLRLGDTVPHWESPL